MPEANEISATFYAMRLLSHQIDLKEISISEDDEYPANEFTPEEQARALEIARETQIEVSSTAGNSDIVEPAIARLADKIDALATKELVDSGHVFEVSLTDSATVPKDGERAYGERIYFRDRLISKLRQDRKIVRLIKEGRSAAKIAELLGVSVSRVKAVRSELEERTQNRTESRQAGID